MQGKQAMDAVRSTVQEMEDQENLLLEQRTQRARGTRRFTSSAIGLGSILGIIFLSIAGLTVNREIRVAAKAQAQVKAFNIDLEQRVEQRTAALQAEVAVRKRTEEMRELLAGIVESSDDAIISKTLDGTISAWNRGAEKVFGYSAAEIVGKSILLLLPPERINEESDLVARIKRGESVEHFETVRVRKGGAHIYVSVTISPIRDSNGMIVGASKVARDITERKLKAEALRESEERFQPWPTGSRSLPGSRKPMGRSTGTTSAGMNSPAQRWSKSQGWAGKVSTIPTFCPRCWSDGRERLPPVHPSIWNFRCAARTAVFARS